MLIGSVVLRHDKPIAWAALQRWLESVLSLRGDSLRFILGRLGGALSLRLDARASRTVGEALRPGLQELALMARSPGFDWAGFAACDGAAGLRRRADTASRYISDFGLAMYCGFGRQPGKDGTETMREHAEVVRSR